ncbi:MmcQ/YjbR family DNA-binding protein [Actinomadura litoris]|uniref:MmcQ/YjbR family DNA-binding protein n=1 Tax=Actinomadura litoris TaxID=2678616 RepID=A0A7K1L4E4_9ACTN|nr:MmcQ/YjbR family DNA-binding protein [Actinomadura litoris]MUN39143.1 MmcQ/YjbR family DNA-binding protein [Actinomadura litoris]
MNVEEFLKAVLALPEVTERDAFGGMTGFRVRGKGFCYLNEPDGTVLLKATREEQAALVAEDPETFTPSWASGRFAWLEVDLATVDPDELQELVTEAWRLSAPKRLTKTLT